MAPIFSLRSICLEKITIIAILLVLHGLFLVACGPSYGWRLLDTQNTPPESYHAAAAYNSTTQQAVVFGGISKVTWLNETWIWNGKDWEKLDPPHSPPGREKAALAYDEQRDKMVLFGGANGNSQFDDTWEWDGTDWQLIVSPHKPPARCCHAMAYDRVQNKVVLVGGWNSQTNTFFSDTWIWDGTDWTETACCSVPLVSAHKLVRFDALDALIVTPIGLSMDTWAWNGSRWYDIPDNLDPPRSEPGAAYDAQFERIVLFGGNHDEQRLNDTWVFDGMEWIALDMAITPPERSGHIMFYDQNRQSIILFGGFDTTNGILNDTWELRLPADISPFLHNPPSASPLPLPSP